MLDQKNQELSATEKAALSRRIAFQKRKLNRLIAQNILISLIVSAGLAMLVLLTSNAPRLAVLLFFATSSCLFGVWSGFSLRQTSRKLISIWESALVENRVSVVRIAAHEMVEFEEVEDEGACYAFQLPDNEVVFVSGQDFYPTTTFPNTDFELAEIRASNGKLVELKLIKHGVKLKPTRIIQAKDQVQLAKPNHLQVLKGRLSEIETLLDKAV
jgi:hypothetical protein